jgi:C_GCAxxG_C_C family probable redox protein
MWEAYGLGNKDFLWAGAGFHGGIAGQQQAPCGAVSAGVIALGFRHRTESDDPDVIEAARKAANDDAAELVKSFNEKFGDITCRGLLGFDFSDEAAAKKAIDGGVFEQKCPRYVEFIIEKLYEMDAKHDAEKAG